MGPESGCDWRTNWSSFQSQCNAAAYHELKCIYCIKLNTKYTKSILSREFLRQFRMEARPHIDPEILDSWRNVPGYHLRIPWGTHPHHALRFCGIEQLFGFETSRRQSVQILPNNCMRLRTIRHIKLRGKLAFTVASQK